jgi:hypothetical protein
MRLSKRQQAALRRARHGLTASEVNRNGNVARTYLSLIKRGLLHWDVFECLVPTDAGNAALNGAS